MWSTKILQDGLSLGRSIDRKDGSSSDDDGRTSFENTVDIMREILLDIYGSKLPGEHIEMNSASVRTAHIDAAPSIMADLNLTTMSTKRRGQDRLFDNATRIEGNRKMIFAWVSDC
ncbi:hypothetical protein CB0940_09846 [Cercospora beticola]|nr:hypothetical protein CB0940_09846 [Cercospora beticola]PIA92241.1 hypothetical protein CB0940_09846 [Cercospora beticola]